MVETEIRFLVPSDAEGLWNLRLEALESETQAFGSSAAEHQLLPVDNFKSRLTSNPEENFVVGSFHNGQLVGMAGFVRETRMKERHKGRVWGVYLADRMRGQGAGKRMLSLLLERAISIEGLEQIMLRVATTQATAIALYRSLGFISYGCEARALKVNDRYLDEEYMALRLTGPPAEK